MNKTKFITQILSCFLIGTALLSLSACGKSRNDIDMQTAENVEQSAETESRMENQDKNILIAYFTAAENSGVDAVSSASYTTINGEAVGRVRAVADMIQAQNKGTLFSIQTSTIYPADGGKLIDQAAEEQNREFRPELTSHIENLDDYDVIFVGYPKMEYGFNCVLCV